MNFGDLQLHDTIAEDPVEDEVKGASLESIRTTTRTIECLPLSQWESLSPRGVPRKMDLAPKPFVNKVAVAHSSTLELSRFQHFIRRMENAGPKIVLDRLKEEWQEAPGEEADDQVSRDETEERHRLNTAQLALEKQLWLLTGFQMQTNGQARGTPQPSCNTGRILELYGNLCKSTFCYQVPVPSGSNDRSAEVFQISAMQPQQTVHFLTNKPQRPVTLPSNVSYLTVRDCGAVPLPYPKNYFSHIRASTLPSLVPSSKMPELFRECYKLLAPGGLLEIRIMDATPVRRTAGPLLRTWIDDRLSVNLERLFRCSKPCSLVPGWLTDAGFELASPEGNAAVTLPCAFDKSSTNVDKELSTVIGRALWRDIWGSFVDEAPDESRWWWDDKDIICECLERQTVFECRAIFAYRT
jgi:hypothetical protein